MMIPRTFAPLALVLLLVVRCFAGNPDWNAAEKRWAAGASATGNPSVAYAVVKNGKVLRMGGIGTTSPVNGRPVGPQTRFYIASVTKPLVALGLVELAARKKIDLGAPVVRYLPEFDLADHEYARQLTLLDLMSHRAGLQSDYLTDVATYFGELDDASFFAALKRVEPTRKFRYSNLNYLILARLIERVTGKPWAEMVRQFVSKPLHMNNTTADAEAFQSADTAAPLAWDGSVVSIAPAQKSRTTMNAAGGMFSSAADFARLLQELTRPQPRVLTADVMRQLFAKESDVTKDFGFIKRTGYGLGWYLGALDNKPLTHAFGSFVGAHVHLSFSPADRIGVVVLANEDTPLVHAVAADIYSLLRNGKFDDKVEFVERLMERHFEKLREQANSHPAPTQAISAAWAGRYEGPGLGDATITPEGLLTVGSIRAHLIVQGDRFTVQLGEDSLSGAVLNIDGEQRLEFLVGDRSLVFRKR